MLPNDRSVLDDTSTYHKKLGRKHFRLAKRFWHAGRQHYREAFALWRRNNVRGPARHSHPISVLSRSLLVHAQAENRRSKYETEMADWHEAMSEWWMSVRNAESAEDVSVAPTRPNIADFMP